MRTRKPAPAARRRHQGKTAWGARLLATRTDLGLGQDALAAKSGVHQATISDIETGRNRHPGDRIKLALATALDTTVYELFPLDELDQAAS